MKKFLVILMVVAMASFLFVGCLGVTPPVDDVDDVDDVVDVAKTETPIITEVSDIDLSLVAESTNYISVTGIAPVGSVIRVYVNDVNTGIGYADVGGIFTVIGTQIGAKILDGAKTLYATATQFGLAESAHSTSYSFTYDTTAPKIASATADSDDLYITVTFNEGVKATVKYTQAAYDAATSTTAMVAAWGMSALNSVNWTVSAGNLTTVEDIDLIAVSTTTIRILAGAAIANGGTFFSVTCTGIGDLVGNAIKVTAPATFGGTIVP